MYKGLNIVDKAISFFNPKYEAKATFWRRQSSLLGSDIYDGATDSEHYQVAPSTTVEEDIYALCDLRSQSNHMYKNNGFYSGSIECSVQHVVGSGLRAKADLKEDQFPTISKQRLNEIEKTLDNYFTPWAKSKLCDAGLKDNFYELQTQVYRNYRRDGDNFALTPLRATRNGNKILQVELIDSSLIESPLNQNGFLEGIRAGKKAEPLQYSILQNDNTYKIVNAFGNGKENVLHTFRRLRAKQVRGIPAASAIFRDITFIDEYMKHELNAAKLAALFFAAIESQKENTYPGANNEFDPLTGELKNKPTAKNTVTSNVVTELQPGDKLSVHTQGRTNQTFDKVVLTSLQKVATHLRIPLEIILTQFVSSYTASRAAMLLMEKFVKPERENILIPSFCNPVRNQVLAWAILQGEINVPEFFQYGVKLFNCIWIGDPMGSVDPQKDVNSRVTAINNNLGNRTKAVSDLGYGDFETNTKLLEEEKKILDSAGLLIKDNEDDNN